MIPEMSPKLKDMHTRVTNFIDEHVIPNEATYERQLDEAPSRWSIWWPS